MRLRRSVSARVCVLFAVLVLGAAPAAGQDVPAPSAAFQPPIHVELRPLDARPRREEAKRPAALVPLYGSLVALQGLDIHSTRRGMTSGKTREANPLMHGVVENGATFIAVKAAATAGAIWATEKLRKKHPKRAVVFAALLNVAMLAVVTHNYRVAD